MIDVLTVAEAAALLKCSPRTVTRLIEAGRLPAGNVGTATHRDWRIKREDLERLFAPKVSASPVARRVAAAESAVLPYQPKLLRRL